MSSGDSGLPIEFVTAVAAQAAATSAAAFFAADQARAAAKGRDGERLLSALLAGPFQESAPTWLLEEAIARGLGEGDPQWAGSGIELAASALTHPDCAEDTRARALQKCTEIQLAHFGTTRRPTILAEASAAELRRRSPTPVPMTRELLTQPTPPQLVLRNERLTDVVFDAAFELLPTRPERRKDADLDSREEYKQYQDRFDAWETMWKGVLQHHPERHRSIVERTENGPANHIIRHLLQGALPWTVEPALLRELASANLDRFHAAILTTQLCRALRAGLSREDARKEFADRIDALPEDDRQWVTVFLDKEEFDPELGCQETADWASSAAENQWRLLLNPTKAKPGYGGDPYTWRTDAEDLADLGRCFAETVLPALEMWEPDRYGPINRAAQLRWVADVLTHLPEVTETVKAAVRPIVADARKGRNQRGSYSHGSYEDRNQLDALITNIEKIIADPAPAVAARRSALGDPAHVSVRDMTTVPASTLADYLLRHAGNDELVEKALLAIASSNTYPPRADFAEVLNQHSDPRQAIHTLTYNLRRRLGGNPPAREAWTREVLALPSIDAETIRALPAWTALKIGGGHIGRAHPEIVDFVTETLGEDTSAWQRLAQSPISYTGPNAWLRLGDVLDCAQSGAPWPAPPPAR
ncbi:hypothetical protein [Catenulispora yoronensis]|uniref:hypothetical protein n=1 Tax=Catenulispora yoronensis TaxID=450799 RepID=UPI0031D8ACCF